MSHTQCSPQYYTTAPTKAIGPAPLPGKKKEKQRLIFLVCTTVDGTEKVIVLMIGKAKRPRFKGLSGAELGLDYESGANALMNSAIFSTGHVGLMQ